MTWCPAASASMTGAVQSPIEQVVPVISRTGSPEPWIS
jgi:hypothetical protein